MANVFLSYRRDDTGALCQALAAELIKYLGKEHVFIDINMIAGGERFPQRLKSAISASDCVVVLIGPQWATIVDDKGQSRLFQPDDLVRFEAEAAYINNKRILPVLAPFAPMPQANELPPSLQFLCDLSPLEMKDENQLNRVARGICRHALAES